MSSVCTQELLDVIASVLHLGNTQFGEEEDGQTYVTTELEIKTLTQVSEGLWLPPRGHVAGRLPLSH